MGYKIEICTNSGSKVEFGNNNCTEYEKKERYKTKAINTDKNCIKEEILLSDEKNVNTKAEMLILDRIRYFGKLLLSSL